MAGRNASPGCIQSHGCRRRGIGDRHDAPQSQDPRRIKSGPEPCTSSVHCDEPALSLHAFRRSPTPVPPGTASTVKRRTGASDLDDQAHADRRNPRGRNPRRGAGRNRLEDFDVETSTKRQLKGNIYLAKVVRVEPSLQAAFVEYGGNRHGFLAFGEIHPDYYQIPVADRQRLLEMQAEEARREEEEEDGAAEPPERRRTGERPDGAERPRNRREATSGPENPGADGRSAPSAAPSRRTSTAGAPSRTQPLRDPAAECPRPARRGDRPSRAAPRSPGSTARVDAEPAEPPFRDRARSVGRRRPAMTRSTRRRPTMPPSMAMPNPASRAPPPETVGGDGDARRRRASAASRRASCATTRSRRSSAAGRSCWCRWSRRSAAPRARR